MGVAHLSGDFVILRRNSSFFVGPGKYFKGSKTFSKGKDACPFLFNLNSRSTRGGSVTDSVKVAASAFLGMPGALAAGAFGAGAATDLLDAPNSECIEEFFGSAAIVLGDNGGVSNSKCLGELSAVAATELHGAADLVDFRGIVSAIGHECSVRHWQHCFQLTS